VGIISSKIRAGNVRAALVSVIVSATMTCAALTASIEPAAANVDPDSAISSVEASLVSAISAVDKGTYKNTAAKAAALSAAIDTVEKSAAKTYGVSLIGEVTFAILVAEALVVANNQGGICTCGHPSCS
jgi:hypothetical protein